MLGDKANLPVHAFNKARVGYCLTEGEAQDRQTADAGKPRL